MSCVNKDELYAKMACRVYRGTKKNSKLYLDAFIDIVTYELAHGNEVNIQGFGKFYAFEYEAHTGKDPRTQEEISVAAKVIPKFSAGAKLKRNVNS